MRVSLFSVFVWHGSLQQRGCGGGVAPDLYYHIYLVPANYDLTDAVQLAYRASFAVHKNAATE